MLSLAHGLFARPKPPPSSGAAFDRLTGIGGIAVDVAVSHYGIAEEAAWSAHFELEDWASQPSRLSDLAAYAHRIARKVIGSDADAMPMPSIGVH